MMYNRLKYIEASRFLEHQTLHSTKYLQFGIASISFPTGKLIYHRGIYCSQTVLQAVSVLATLTCSQPEEN